MPRKRRNQGKGKRDNRKMVPSFEKDCWIRSRNANDGLPRTSRTRLHYATTFKIQGEGQLGVTKYRANGAWDPEYATGGGAPATWDNWAIKYNHYCVIKSAIKVRLCSTSTGQAGEPGIIGAYLSDDEVLPFTKGTDIVAAGRGTNVTVSSFLTREATVTTSYKAQAFFNVKDPVECRPIGGDVSSLPQDEALFVVYGQSLQDTSFTFSGIVELCYDVVFFEPKDIAPNVNVSRVRNDAWRIPSLGVSSTPTNPPGVNDLGFESLSIGSCDEPP